MWVYQVYICKASKALLYINSYIKTYIPKTINTIGSSWSEVLTTRIRTHIYTHAELGLH